MEKLSFDRFLFKTAVCVMGCDGEINEMEKTEIIKIATTTLYFGEIDIREELNTIVREFSKKGKGVIKDYFNELENSNLSVLEELMVLEVALRMMYADARLEENEIRFLKMVRSRLSLWDLQIKERFGNVDLLFGHQEEMQFKVSVTDYIDQLELPDYTLLEGVEVKKVEK